MYLPATGFQDRYRWAHCGVRQVFNTVTDTGVTPVSEAPAAAVRAAWLPLLPGQEVPLLGERTVTGDGCPGDGL